MYMHTYTYIVSQSKITKSPHDLRNMPVVLEYQLQLSQAQTQIPQKVVVSKKDNKIHFIKVFHSMKFSVNRFILNLSYGEPD